MRKTYLHTSCSLCAMLLVLGLTVAPVQALAGYRYVKVSNSGYALDSSAQLGGGPDEWACTYDRVEGLIWEVKTTSGLRSQDHSYTWYDSGQAAGSEGVFGVPGTCENPSGPYETCNTENYVQAVNSTGLCGASDWRMPTGDELESLVVHGHSPTIDAAWFPNTPIAIFWTSESYNSDAAWYIYFLDGLNSFRGKDDLGVRVRLVRDGQPFTPLPAAVSIPTLSQWAALALAGLLGLTSLAALRKRGQRG